MRGAGATRVGACAAAPAVLGLAGLLAFPALAAAASDVWGNVGPGSDLAGGGISGRYPLGHYGLDQHFDAVSASLTGGVDVSGVPPMIAYFLASVIWALTSFLANLMISVFGFAFSLDLLGGSEATGGAGALAPVSGAIHSIYARVLGAPWLIVAVAIAGVWAMWKALVQRRYAETAGALGLSLVFVIAALFFVVQPAKTIGAASRWTNQLSEAFLSVSTGAPSGARREAADRLFDLLVFRPWVVLDFGGTEHCVEAGTGSGDSDPKSLPVRPLDPDPRRDAELARRLRTQSELSAGRKECVNNARKYAQRFLRHGPGTDQREAEYEALDDGDSSEVSGEGGGGYELGPEDKPATDAMEAGGQYQRLLLAILVLAGELGAFLLLGALSVGVILAQILLLVLLAFSPVALIAAAIPGRGHAFFRGWLEKLAGFLLRKVAYSLVLAVVLAVNGALAAATAGLGWLLSFGLQAAFFWAVFLQRQALTEGLVGIATGPGAPGREGTLRVLALYQGARVAAAPLRRAGRGARSALGGSGGEAGDEGAPEPAEPSPRGEEPSERAGGGLYSQSLDPLPGGGEGEPGDHEPQGAAEEPSAGGAPVDEHQPTRPGSAERPPSAEEQPGDRGAETAPPESEAREPEEPRPRPSEPDEEPNRPGAKGEEEVATRRPAEGEESSRTAPRRPREPSESPETDPESRAKETRSERTGAEAAEEGDEGKPRGPSKPAREASLDEELRSERSELSRRGGEADSASEPDYPASGKRPSAPRRERGSR